MTKAFNWDEAFEEIAQANRAAHDKADAPEAVAARKRKQAEEFERGVRLGWWDANGDPLPQDDEAEDDDDDDENDEEAEAL